MKFKPRHLWIVVYCLAAFNLGYLGNEWLNQRVARARFVQGVTWAISEGLLTVNAHRLSELEGHGNRHTAAAQP